MAWVPFTDYRTKSLTHRDRWGRRFYLYVVDEGLANVLDRDGVYVATVQRTESGWRYYGEDDAFASRKPRKSIIDAFFACVDSSYVRSRYER